MQEISDKQFDDLENLLGKATISIIEIITSVINNLPEPHISEDLKELSLHINSIKSEILKEDIYTSKEQWVVQVVNANNQIFMIISELLEKEYNLEIISNVIFWYIIRSSAIINTHITEENFYKMEFYFSEIINSARQQIHIL